MVRAGGGQGGWGLEGGPAGWGLEGGPAGWGRRVDGGVGGEDERWGGAQGTLVGRG